MTKISKFAATESPSTEVETQMSATSLSSEDDWPAGSRLARRLQDDHSLRRRLQSQPTVEVANELLRLRRYRGLSQQAVADLAGTTQSVIARHEGGWSNMSLRSLHRVLNALNAVIRVELIPYELEALRTCTPRWWQLAEIAEEAAMEVQIFYRRLDSPTAVEATPSAESTWLSIGVTGEWSYVASPLCAKADDQAERIPA